MNDKCFLDTNILVYTYSNNELEKQLIARQIVAKNSTFISTQVLQELCNIAIRKLKFKYTSVTEAVKECRSNNNVHINTPATVVQACHIAEDYGYSFYDSLILAAALETGCKIIYSEDMSDQQIINGTLRIVNPFKT